MGSIGCPETSVYNYQYTLRNNPEERRPEHSGLTLKNIFRNLSESKKNLAMTTTSKVRVGIQVSRPNSSIGLIHKAAL
jgi:hypothetical protein